MEEYFCWTSAKLTDTRCCRFKVSLYVAKIIFCLGFSLIGQLTFHLRVLNAQPATYGKTLFSVWKAPCSHCLAVSWFVIVCSEKNAIVSIIERWYSLSLDWSMNHKYCHSFLTPVLNLVYTHNHCLKFCNGLFIRVLMYKYINGILHKKSRMVIFQFCSISCEACRCCLYDHKSFGQAEIKMIKKQLQVEEPQVTKSKYAWYPPGQNNKEVINSIHTC